MAHFVSICVFFVSFFSRQPNFPVVFVTHATSALILSQKQIAIYVYSFRFYTFSCERQELGWGCSLGYVERHGYSIIHELLRIPTLSMN